MTLWWLMFLYVHLVVTDLVSVICYAGNDCGFFIGCCGQMLRETDTSACFLSGIK